MSNDFNEKRDEAADEHSMTFGGCDGINGPGEPPQYDQAMHESFIAGADWARNILSSSFDRVRKEDFKKSQGAIKVLAYERTLLQELTRDYVNFFKVADCQFCDPTTGFTCPECAHWNRCSEVLKTLGIRK